MMNNLSSNKRNAWAKPNIDSVQRGEAKFRAAQQKLEEAVKKHANDCESSEEEDELETDNIINKILQKYTQNATTIDIGRTNSFLQDAFQSGANTCLICISSIKRTEPVWNCDHCYCCFHLMCIQRWSKDTIVHKKQALEAQVQYRRIVLNWGCPKCRAEYDPDYIPNDYYCFCKKTLNPPFQTLLVPHSCGNTCEKPLKPDCGHKCLLLCHPGPCPPCPQTVKVSCYCGAAPQVFQRCTNKEWSCGAQCNKELSCGKHKCLEVCHPGECKPCSKKSMQKCKCTASIKLRDCISPVWQCDKICNKPLSCGHHKCEIVCHDGDCGDCPRSKERTCPCGKTFHQLDCTDEVPTCGDTCGKPLDCGIHFCQQRCHKGNCQICLETVNKACRCGQHKKDIQCCKVYLCETKCKNIRDCNKHACNRKCCDGNCPPCEKPCGKTLSCKKHCCTSICHQGPCYPCNMTEKVSCFCGGTTITVPCGRKHRTKPPKCNKLCKTPPECHHKSREAHKCHFGDCPSCQQICAKIFEKCKHTCPARCHSAVLVKLQPPPNVLPWENKGPQVEKRCLPCPPCPAPITVTCFGGHETSDYPCHLARPMSCHRPCGRLLHCSNHKCSLECHMVENAKDGITAGSNCEICNLGCDKPRVAGCTHPCPKPCHPGECPPCTNMLRITCHCGLSQPYVNCYEWTTSRDKELLQSCGNQCQLNFSCGHRCRANCHSGECPCPELCKKKVKIFCSCKRLKKEFTCDVVRIGNVSVPCDDSCTEKQLKEKKEKELKDMEKRKVLEERNKRELEKYEKMFAKRKAKEKKVSKEVTGRNNIQKYLLITFGILLVAVIIYRMFLY